ncbi:MAG: L-threonylcarbamoyladenylate synthase [Pseudomonadota bacterium]
MSGKNVTEVVLADPEGIARAARILKEGGLVAVPTETVYGLAARADSDEAVAKIYAAKGRPDFNPLIVHVRNTEQAKSYGSFPYYAHHLSGTEWPGPLTLVVQRKPQADLAEAVTAGLSTIALRSPSHPVMRALLEAVDFPLAAPSANRSGFISPTKVEHVLASLDGRIDLVLDDGRPCPGGVESTILAVREDDSWEELRPGPLDPDRLNLDYRGNDRPGDWQPQIEAPGQMASHYAPGKPVRLKAREAKADEFYIGFGGGPSDCNLSRSGDLLEAASRLYDCLHQGAASDMPRIAVAPIPEKGVGRAINDRLRRAATEPD